MNQENFFTDLENTRPFLKVGIEGFPYTGKTFTAALMAIGLHQKIQSEKPIIIFDTEKSSAALRGLFEEAGIKVKVKESRTLADLTKTMELCERGASDILMVDSITHIWEGFLSAYLKQKKRDRMYLPDWGVVKPKWKEEFSQRFVFSNIHIIFTGRAGYEYEEVDGNNNQKQLVKSGIKMKAENETAHEPDFLILMERVESLVNEKKSVKHVAFILKDRTNKIHAQSFDNPDYEDFRPAIDELIRGNVKETQPETPDTFDSVEDKQFQRSRNRDIMLDEIKTILQSLGLGTSANDKQIKTLIMDEFWGTTSWKVLEAKSVEELSGGLLFLKEFKVTFKKSPPESMEDAIKLIESAKRELNSFNEKMDA